MFIQDDPLDKIGNTDQFGKDKHVVKEMLTFMLKSEVYRYGMLCDFSKRKEENLRVIKKLIDKPEQFYQENK